MRDLAKGIQGKRIYMREPERAKLDFTRYPVYLWFHTHRSNQAWIENIWEKFSERSRKQNLNLPCIEHYAKPTGTK